jgi:enterochelin esterase family protein
MKILMFLVFMMTTVLAKAGLPVEEFMTDNGLVKIIIIYHASLMIEWGGMIIQVDPVGVQQYDTLPSADLILITHTHPDHFDLNAINKLKKTGTVILGPKAAQQLLAEVKIANNNDHFTFGKCVIDVVPAYNLTRGPSAGHFYHPKGDGNGYIVTLGNKRFYIAGDTENIPELAGVKNIEAAFIPINLPYTMTPEEAAALTKVIKPKYVYPYHYRGTDLSAFTKALEGSGIEVRLRNWYMGENASPGNRTRPGTQQQTRPDVQTRTRPDSVRATAPAVVSPQVQPDGQVTFRINAPKATEVILTGDIWKDASHKEKMTKNDQGVWSVTIGPLSPDIYSYYFLLDGVQVADPVNGWIKPGVRSTANMFLVPGNQADFLLEQKVPHGEVRILYYWSSVLNKEKRMHIYLPPGYETSKNKYPVLYLLHGAGDFDDGWISIGRADLILDNLIAQGKSKQMIIVCPSIWALGPPVPSGQSQTNSDLFGQELLKDIMSYVQKNFRVLPGSENRAIGGLSVPNILPDFLFANYDKFDYVGFTSNGLTSEKLAFYNDKYPGLITNPDNVRRVKFWIGDGSNSMTFTGTTYLAKAMKDYGYNTTFYTTEGIHGWPWFRRYLAEFSMQLFK